MTLSLVVLAVATTTLAVTEARREFISLIPNGANVPDVPAVGHSYGTGKSGSLNVFGNAFKSAGNKWTTSLCRADSDGDGQTNGQKLSEPCCEWSQGGTPRFTTGLSDPGVKTSQADATTWTNLTCPSMTPSPSAGSHAAMAALAAAVVGAAVVANQ